MVLATCRRGSPRSTARSGSAWTPRSGSIDRSKLNVNGSSLAAGHPFAATGGRIVAQLAKQLAEKKKETGQPVRGLISICAAGGQGVDGDPRGLSQTSFRRGCNAPARVSRYTG